MLWRAPAGEVRRGRAGRNFDACLADFRLGLRPSALGDAAAYSPLVSDPAVLRYTGKAPLRSLDEVEALQTMRPLRDDAMHRYGRLA